MDQYIYKTFKMLQNGLYWSFYCCSSIWIFVQIVKIRCRHHFAQYTIARERLPEPVSNGQTTSKLSPPTHREKNPTPTGGLNFVFLSHSGIKRNQMKVSGSDFLQSTIQPLKAQKKIQEKEDLCGREANQGLW